jgi:acyl carrier protein
MADAAIYTALDEIFRDVFLRDDLVLSPELSAKDVSGWNSLKQIEILIAVQEHFSIKFRAADLDNMNNVGDLMPMIAAKARSD